MDFGVVVRMCPGRNGSRYRLLVDGVTPHSGHTACLTRLTGPETGTREAQRGDGPFQVCSDPDKHLNIHPETSSQVKSAFQPTPSVSKCDRVRQSVPRGICGHTKLD